MRQLIVDPEFQKQIPPLTSEELDQLEKNILQEGQVLDPIIVWNDIILDGHNRYQIIQGHPPPKEKKVTEKPAVTPPQPDSKPIELSPEQKCADALNELTDAVEMYVFRWDRCFLIYKDIFNTNEMQVEARKLIDQMQKYVDEKLEELNECKRDI